MAKRPTRVLVLAALFLALGILLPFLTGQLKEVGDSLLPMHLPVLLCGIVCGSGFGFGVGLILPLLRAVTVGMPPLYPNAVWMAAELATYGLVIGLLYHARARKTRGHLFFSLIVAMLAGRIVWGGVKALLLGVAGKGFTVQAFIAGGFIDALPGIILQLILIPLIVEVLRHTAWRDQA